MQGVHVSVRLIYRPAGCHEGLSRNMASVGAQRCSRMTHPDEDVPVNWGERQAVHEVFSVVTTAHSLTLAGLQMWTSAQMQEPFGRIGR